MRPKSRPLVPKSAAFSTPNASKLRKTRGVTPHSAGVKLASSRRARNAIPPPPGAFDIDFTRSVTNAMNEGSDGLEEIIRKEVVERLEGRLRQRGAPLFQRVTTAKKDSPRARAKARSSKMKSVRSSALKTGFGQAKRLVEAPTQLKREFAF